ncbi:cytochrome P450 [Sordaria brevicollis]|uniref:Cytochrome P450 n=1 Tax=Sordaria brevicollis TaxID=83679 RepID=A0AAE0PMJ1_SORBR|nr:cytochrome P450 [Sordaria brevicollis]
MDSFHLLSKLDTQTLHLRDWPHILAFISIILILSLLTTYVANYRPSLPLNAPPLSKTSDWAILGSLRFFTDRYRFYNEGVLASKTGNFSFYFGKHHLVGLSGVEARKAFFEKKELNMTKGYAVFLTVTPPTPEDSKPVKEMHYDLQDKWFARYLFSFMKSEALDKSLPLVVTDVRNTLDDLATRCSASPTGEGLTDPFDSVYKLVFQLTMRTLGISSWASSSSPMLAKSLDWFETIDKSTSPIRIIFPWLPTVNHFRRMTASAKLYFAVKDEFADRVAKKRREDDAMQHLIDNGEDAMKVLIFIIASLYAAHLNTSTMACWLVVYLAAGCEKEEGGWYKLVRDEVDGALRKHRKDEKQSVGDVLATLTLDEWEAEFPVIQLCLKETTRLQAVGTSFRRNVSGKDVVLGGSGEVVPHGGFATYLLDDVHVNPSIYPDPLRWDPGRYLPDRAEDKKEPLAFLGWGAGRHPCLGMRLAKLEIAILVANLVSMFDFSLCDKKGRHMSEAPETNRSNHTSSGPDTPVRLKYKLREPWA